MLICEDFIQFINIVTFETYLALRHTWPLFTYSLLLLVSTSPGFPLLCILRFIRGYCSSVTSDLVKLHRNQNISRAGDCSC